MLNVKAISVGRNFAHPNSVLCAHRPKQWAVAKAMEWLVANPIVAEAEVTSSEPQLLIELQLQSVQEVCC